MKLVAISDTHNQHKKLVVPDGDVFIHAGDASVNGTKEELVDFFDWMSGLPHRHKLMVVGNHDRKGFFEHTEPMKNSPYFEWYPNISFLIHSELTIDGASFYGCASMRLSKVNPVRYGDSIKDAPQTDVLITHNAPLGIMDELDVHSEFGPAKKNLGDQEILDYVKVKPPKISIFGHIHEKAGQATIGSTAFYNVAACNDSQVLVRGCVEIEIEPKPAEKL